MDYVYFDDIFGSMDLCFQIQAWCYLCIGFSFCCSCDNCCFTSSSQTNQPVSLHSLWQLRMGCLPWNIIEATSILFEIEFWILYLLWLKKNQLLKLRKQISYWSIKKHILKFSKWIRKRGFCWTNQPVSLHSLWQLRMGSFPWNIIEATSILYENLSEKYQIKLYT